MPWRSSITKLLWFLPTFEPEVLLVNTAKVGLVRGLQFRFQRNWGEDGTRKAGNVAGKSPCKAAKLVATHYAVCHQTTAWQTLLKGFERYWKVFQSWIINYFQWFSNYIKMSIDVWHVARSIRLWSVGYVSSEIKVLESSTFDDKVPWRVDAVDATWHGSPPVSKSHRRCEMIWGLWWDAICDLLPIIRGLNGWTSRCCHFSSVGPPQGVLHCFQGFQPWKTLSPVRHCALRYNLSKSHQNGASMR